MLGTFPRGVFVKRVHVEQQTEPPPAVRRGSDVGASLPQGVGRPRLRLVSRKAEATSSRVTLMRGEPGAFVRVVGVISF